MDITKTAPAKTDFQQALLIQRARLQLKRREIANQCAVPEDTVYRWERGESVPNVQQFKRLVGLMRRMISHPPAWGVMAGSIVASTRFDQQRAELADFEKENRHIEPEVRPPPVTFGAGLRAAREENESYQKDLGEVIGVEQSTISAWERDETLPVQDNLNKLFMVLPELKAGIDTGAVMRPESRDHAKPPGPQGMKFPRASTIDQALDMVMEQSDQERKRDAPPDRPRWSPQDAAVDHHEHVFNWSEQQLDGRPSHRVCMICGEFEVKPPTAEAEVRQPKAEHQHIIRRCPCGGPVEKQKLDNCWICLKCKQMLCKDDLVGPTVTDLAQAFGAAMIRMTRAKILKKQTEAAARAAEFAETVAENELNEARELLELAVAEDE